MGTATTRSQAIRLQAIRRRLATEATGPHQATRRRLVTAHRRQVMLVATAVATAAAKVAAETEATAVNAGRPVVATSVSGLLAVSQEIRVAEVGAEARRSEEIRMTTPR